MQNKRPDRLYSAPTGFIYCNHLLRSAIHGLGGRGARPQILLTTVKDEEHMLGLLMVEALLAASGAWCLSVGAQTPIADIVGAARGTTIDIVALSSSGAYPARSEGQSALKNYLTVFIKLSKLRLSQGGVALCRGVVNTEILVVEGFPGAPGACR